MPASRHGRNILKKPRPPLPPTSGDSSPSPPTSPDSKKKYLFPRKPKSTRLVKFKSGDDLVKVHEVEHYDRTPYPMASSSRGPLPPDNDRVLINPGPVVQRPRMTRTNALRGAAMRAALDGVESTDIGHNNESAPPLTPDAELLNALKAGDWATAEKLSAALTPDEAFPSDQGEFEEAFFKQHSKDSDIQTISSVSSTPSPRTPADEMKLLVGDAPTVRFITPKGEDNKDDVLPLERVAAESSHLGLTDVEMDLDASVTSLSELHLTQHLKAPAQLTPGERRWPESLPPREPSRLFAQRHHVQLLEPVGPSSEGLYPEISLTDTEDESEGESIEELTASMSFSSRTSRRQQRKLKHCIANSPFGSLSKGPSGSGAA